MDLMEEFSREIQNFHADDENARLLAATLDDTGRLTMMVEQWNEERHYVVGMEEDFIGRVREYDSLRGFIIDMLNTRIYEPTEPGNPADGTEHAELAARYPDATWYRCR